MRTVIVEYVLDTPASRGQKLQEALGAANNVFKGMPGLLSKQWTYDATNGKGTNIYLWESAQAADGFFTDDFAGNFEAMFGVLPSVTMLDTLAVVDNKAGEVTDNPG